LQVADKQDKSQFPRYIADFLAVPVTTHKWRGVRFFVCLSLKQINIDVGQVELEEKRPGEYNGRLLLRALREGKAEIDAIFHSLHPSRFPATDTYPETPDEHIDVAFRRFAWGRDLLPVLWDTMIDDLNNQLAASGAKGGQPAPAVGNGGPVKSTLPKWWPKKGATKVKWKTDLRALRRLREKHGNNFRVIAKDAKMSRGRVSRIFQWAELDPEAHN
jgi:hypothetical protein